MYPRTYEGWRELVRSWALEKANATSIIRKSGFRPTPATSGGVAPVLSLYGSKRVCFTPDGILHAGRPVNFAVSGGDLYAWGTNLNNVMGLAVDELVDFHDTPTKIASGMGDVVEITSSSVSSALVRSDGSAWTTGIPDTGTEGVPHAPLAGLTGIIGAAATDEEAYGALYFLNDEGRVWGLGQYMPGMGTSGSPHAGPNNWTDDIDVPTLMPEDEISGVVEIETNGQTTTSNLFFRKGTGEIGRWQNGQGSAVYPSSPPADPVVKISAGRGHVMALTDAGDIYVAGTNNAGQYGNGTTGIVTGYPDWNQTDGGGYEDIAGGNDCSFAVKDGDLYEWGQGTSQSARGIGAADVSTPTLVSTDVDDFASVHAHYKVHAPMAKTDGGCVYIWGAQTFGQLGQGYTLDPDIGEPVPLLISRAWPEWPLA